MTSYSHLFVHVRDLERTREFYADLLGLTVLLEHPGYLRVGGGEGFHIGFEERPEAEVGAAGVEIVIRVDDVDAEHRRLSDAGVAFATAPQDQDWGARHAWLTDPDGYRLSVYSVPTGG
jgi:predicted enzyme related to lactoylglutathione lyase